MTLFDFGPPDFSGPLDVRPVVRETADHWFAQYHYSGTSGLSTPLFYRGVCSRSHGGGAALATNNEHGACQASMDLPGARVPWRSPVSAVHPQSRRNTASRVVAAVLSRLVAPQGIYPGCFPTLTLGKTTTAESTKHSMLIYVGRVRSNMDSCHEGSTQSTRESWFTSSGTNPERRRSESWPLCRVTP